MILSYKFKLTPADAQADSLRQTMMKVNEACNYIADCLILERVTNKVAAQRILYKDVRERFHLSAQLTIRAIARVCASLKARSNGKYFRPLSAIEYDARSLSLKGCEMASILTLTGRQVVSIAPNPYLSHIIGVARENYRLQFHKGIFFLIIAISVPEPELKQHSGVLGVDLGQHILAVDSDGCFFDGSLINKKRQYICSLRDRLQSCGTKSAKRRLKKLKGKERAFQRDTNHCISKKLVAKAQGTHRIIALEDLSGIRERTVVRKAQRRNHNSWAFRELANFIGYKARLNGVGVVFIDPKYTSQTCPICKHISHRNRISRDDFKCESCGFVGHADHVGAVNIALRGYTKSPIVSGRYLATICDPQEQVVKS